MSTLEPQPNQNLLVQWFEKSKYPRLRENMSEFADSIVI